MSRTSLWTRAALAMREDPDPRWHAVADWLRSEAACQDEMEPFAELINAGIEQASGVKGYIRFGRTADGDPMLSIDTNEAATAVALAYLDEQPETPQDSTEDDEAPA